VLVSGDGDLACGECGCYRGARVEVVSLRSMTSDSLINVSDRYNLEGIKEIQKTPACYTYRPLSSLGFMDESQDGRSDVIKTGRISSSASQQLH